MPGVYLSIPSLQF